MLGMGSPSMCDRAEQHGEVALEGRRRGWALHNNPLMPWPRPGCPARDDAAVFCDKTVTSNSAGSCIFLQTLSLVATFGSSAPKHGHGGGPREPKQPSGSQRQSETQHNLHRLLDVMLGLFTPIPVISRYWSLFSTAFSYDLFLVKKWTMWMSLKTNFKILKAVLLLKSNSYVSCLHT